LADPRDVKTLENDDRVKVVVFESAVDGFFLNHSDFLANIEDLTASRKVRPASRHGPTSWCA